MAEADASSRQKAEITEPRFNPLKIIIPVLLALLSVSLMSQWYASQISFPRYCKSPEITLKALRELLEAVPVIDSAQRRQSMIAAKILFLYPMYGNENNSDYLLRIRQLMSVECR